MQVLLSHSVAPEYGPLAERVKAIGSMYGRRIILPDRSEHASTALTASTQVVLRDADLVVALISARGRHHRLVQAETEEALRQGKPVLVLVEDTARFRGPRDAVTAQFSQSDISEAESAFRAFVNRHASTDQKEAKGLSAVLLFALSLLLMAATRDRNVGPATI